MFPGLRCALVIAALSLVPVAPAPAQELVQSPVVTLNQERLYTSSAFGRRVKSDLDRRSEVLASENRRIETQLIEEERKLTDERAGMPVAEFRALATDFDERVTEIRQAQTEKEEDLQRFADRERSRFFTLIVPILQELIVETGAVAILSSSAVLLARGEIDITDLAIARADTRLGAAPPAAETGPSPAKRPEGVPPDETAPAPQD